MSRLLIVASLVRFTAFTTAASADRAAEPPAPAERPVPAHRFSQPPPGAGAPADYIVPVALDRAQIRAKLAATRRLNLQRFRAYQKAGVFPSNTYAKGKLNVWHDEQGHYCAAATIIRASGQIKLVERVAEQSNFIRLADVEQGPLMDWILTSGLTQDEIAAIQEPFMPVVEEPVMVRPPRIVDRGMREREDARLRARYRVVDRMIVKNTKASLDAATARLMSHPDLAWKFLAS